jgi:hypothetical protein
LRAAAVSAQIADEVLGIDPAIFLGDRFTAAEAACFAALSLDNSIRRTNVQWRRKKPERRNVT